MKTSRKWNFKSIAGNLMMGLALTAMVGSIGVAPVFAKNDPKSQGRHDNGRYQNRGRGYDARPVYQPYGYYGHRERYYPPPPVIYAPPPPPGIGIFFPPVFIHP